MTFSQLTERNDLFRSRLSFTQYFERLNQAYWVCRVTHSFELSWRRGCGVAAFKRLSSSNTISVVIRLPVEPVGSHFDQVVCSFV